MSLDLRKLAQDYDSRFKGFHELMSRKVNEILLVSSLYDACIMEEDCRLAEGIIHEYRGLNLSKPPRLTWVSSAEKALRAISERRFDLVITMPRLADMDPEVLGREVKKLVPDLPVILLTHNAMPYDVDGGQRRKSIDRIFVWTGNTDLMVAMIKSVEDRLNVARDTLGTGVRVILFVEDSPIYMSSLLPILYKEVVRQTQAVMEEGLNESHRLLTMRARPKILVAENYEEAEAIVDRYKAYLLGVISDTRFKRGGKLNDDAGLNLLAWIKEEIPDLPTLLTSSDPSNRAKASMIPAAFIDKNSPTLHEEVKVFFLRRLGFGDFVFRLPNGREVARASNPKSLEKILPTVPDESFFHHWRRNDFSRWLFARTEFKLASSIRPVTAEDFEFDVQKMRDYLIENFRVRRKMQQKGVLVDFDAQDFDPDTDFLKIGKGSVGGKARGLVFISTLLRRNPQLLEKYADVDIQVPKSLIITTEAFVELVQNTDLRNLSELDVPDEEVAARFLDAELPQYLADDLRAYLEQVKYPLAVRSSGLLEDAQFRAYAGLYRTYMLPNDHPDLDVRLVSLIDAVKLVYASTYYQGPKRFAYRVGQRTEEEKMAVVIQQLIGDVHGGYFYPTISGVAQSHNYYPISRIKPEDGCATIALGLGKTVVEGGKALRFSPKHPHVLPQFSKVDDILTNSQKTFYALRLGQENLEVGTSEESTLVRRDISEADLESPLQLLASTYVPDEHRIRDTVHLPGNRVITFAGVLKHKVFPLASILSDVLELSQEGMGCPVEIEFSTRLCREDGCRPEFAFLQLRPMTARAELAGVEIDENDRRRAFCYSTQALGNSIREDLRDILFVKPDAFDPGRTLEIARDIGRFNAELRKQRLEYLLIGPGRWGSADRWLGIPVEWSDISSVGAVVETTSPRLKAEPSQGSHFFHNVTTLGIAYFTVTDQEPDLIDWAWLQSLPIQSESKYAIHARLDNPYTIKVDGRKSIGVIYA